MKPWSDRVREEAYLLNPAFSAANLSAALSGYETVGGSGMAFPLTFMILPIILHTPTRRTLPSSVRTTMPAWLQAHAEARVLFLERVTSLLPHTREALHFGLRHGLLTVDDKTRVRAAPTASQVDKMLRSATGEVHECGLKARFLGRWFASTGSPATAMALWGVRP